jgi:hypothetical protein
MTEERKHATLFAATVLAARTSPSLASCHDQLALLFSFVFQRFG